MRRSAGFSLIELSLILLIAGLLILLAVAVVPVLTEWERLDTTDVTLQDVKEAVVSFAGTKSRLPCPDMNGDGLEGTAGTCAAGDRVGAVPYRALGFPDPVLDEAHLPVRYAVYRNENGGGPDDADLAVAPVPNRFVPLLPATPPTLQVDPAIPSEGLDPTRKEPANQNDLDFCLALRNAKTAGSLSAHTHTLDGAIPRNAAFVLVSGGVEDADGDAADSSLDGENEGAGEVDFESPARRRQVGPTAADSYDDLVHAMPFDVLQSKLSCAAITIGVNSAANVANAAAHLVVQAEDTLWAAQLAAEMDDITIVQAGFDVALAILSTLMAGTDLGVSLGSCGCAPLSDACTAGAVAAGIAVGLGVGVSAAAIAALDLANQLTAGNDAALIQAIADAAVLTTFAGKACQDAANADARGGQGITP